VGVCLGLLDAGGGVGLAWGCWVARDEDAAGFVPAWRWGGSGDGAGTLLRRAGLLIAVVHEGAGCALGVEAGGVDRGTALGGVESAGEERVGAEFGRTSVELAGVAED